MTSAVAPPRLIVITHPGLGDEVLVQRVAAVAAALPPGVLAVQLRDKARERRALYALAVRLRAATTPHGAMLLVNADAEVARDAGADGVHLGGGAMSVADARQVLGETSWISVAAHTDGDVAWAVEHGADAALVSPIFTTPGKGVPRGIGAIESARALAKDRIALYALGGVDRVTAPLCVRAGATGVAAVGAVLKGSDPAAEAQAIYEAMLHAVVPPRSRRPPPAH